MEAAEEKYFVTNDNHYKMLKEAISPHVQIWINRYINYFEASQINTLTREELLSKLNDYKFEEPEKRIVDLLIACKLNTNKEIKLAKLLLKKYEQDIMMNELDAKHK